jgi:hypothetical protein
MMQPQGHWPGAEGLEARAGAPIEPAKCERSVLVFLEEMRQDQLMTVLT